MLAVAGLIVSNSGNSHDLIRRTISSLFNYQEIKSRAENSATIKLKNLLKKDKKKLKKKNRIKT
jgi:hypothetical protein